MKKLLITFAATTALWAALASSLVYWNFLYVLTRADVSALEEAYEGTFDTVNPISPLASKARRVLTTKTPPAGLRLSPPALVAACAYASLGPRH